MKKTWTSSAHQGYVKENMHSNTLSAFELAAEMGADSIETDARTTRDGVLICCHDDVVRGEDEMGYPVEYKIEETDSSVILGVILAPNDPRGIQRVPTLESALKLCYYTGMKINIDLKEGMKSALKVAELVLRMGMRGRALYATNGSGAECILEILKVDPDAQFVDTPYNYTAEKLAAVPGYQTKCFAYTADFSDENIAKIKKSGCMLLAISLNEGNVLEAFRHHPDAAEYPHTSDFTACDALILRERP